MRMGSKMPDNWSEITSNIEMAVGRFDKPTVCAYQTHPDKALIERQDRLIDELTKYIREVWEYSKTTEKKDVRIMCKIIMANWDRVRSSAISSRATSMTLWLEQQDYLEMREECDGTL